MDAADLKTARENVHNARLVLIESAFPFKLDFYAQKIGFGHFQIYSAETEKKSRASQRHGDQSRDKATKNRERRSNGKRNNRVH